MSELSGKHGTVAVATMALWRLRAGRLLTRRLLQGAALAGLLASARIALDPPRAPAPRAVQVQRRDVGAEWLATLFARRYLTWSAADPQTHARGLAGLLADSADPDAGLRPQTRAGERVISAQIAQERPGARGERVFTVAVDTNHSGEIYLSVAVARRADGSLVVSRFPALVGPPLVARAQLAVGGGSALSDGELASVVERALGNYLAGSRENLAADLAAGARVSSLPAPLALERVDELRAQRDGSVAATVQAHDSAGADFTLTYELDVERLAGRWEVSAIQTDPTT